jgi:sugar/nucleoside kinase (ribokinase family)
MQGGVVGIGSALVDELVFVDDRFVSSFAGSKGGTELISIEELQRLRSAFHNVPNRVPGGSAANTIFALAALGMPTTLITKIGDDEAGRFYRNHTAAAGVNTAAFKVHNRQKTGTCVSMITPDSQRTMRTFLGAAATMWPEEITNADFADCRHAHIEGYLLFNRDLIIQVLRQARENGCTVSLDLSAPEVVEASHDVLKDLLADYVDIVLANEDEAAAFCGTRDEDKCLKILSEYCPMAVVKLGARGAILQNRGRRFQFPALKVRAIDTTGAGDLWAAGFLYGILNNSSIETAAAIGASAAAAVIQISGASLPTASWNHIISELNLKGLRYYANKNSSLLDR